MLAWFSDLPLRAKFVAVTTLVGTVATAFATASFLFYANTATRAAMVRETTALTLVIAENTSAALVFNDPAAADQTLTALSVRSDVVGVRLARPSGETFVEYGNVPKVRSEPDSEGVTFDQNFLRIERPVLLDGDVVGTLELVASLDALREERNALVLIAVVIAGLSTLIAFILSSTLQRALVRPITHLAGVMRQVSAEKEYWRRAERHSDDEIGDLITGFNQMLEQIETQHRELAIYRKDLESLVAERTRQLEEANRRLEGTVTDLQSSTTALEAANRTKSEFLANMSHELRTPLNAINGFSEIMTAEMFGPLGNARYAEYVSDIAHSATHLIDIISDILDMTRIESGKFTLREEIVELDAMISDALRVVAPALSDKALTLDRHPLPDPAPMLRCDSVRVRQVLINLLSNAVKFTDREGDIFIRVRVEDGLVIEIADTGIGIDEADIERVMTPFAQVEGAFARSYQGTGLGLSLSKGLMELHDGCLALESRLGEGTTVTLRFPPERIAYGSGLLPDGGEDGLAEQGATRSGG